MSRFVYLSASAERGADGHAHRTYDLCEDYYDGGQKKTRVLVSDMRDETLFALFDQIVIQCGQIGYEPAQAYVKAGTAQTMNELRELRDNLNTMLSNLAKGDG
jgi:hypothetical protein